MKRLTLSFVPIAASYIKVPNNSHTLPDADQQRIFSSSPTCYNFIQLSDPQLGMYEKYGLNEYLGNWVIELENVDNALHEIENDPKFLSTENVNNFVILTGDLVNDKPEEAEDLYNTDQIKDLQRILDKHPKTEILQLPGNHDVGNTFKNSALESYKKNWGSDYFSFTDRKDLDALNEAFTKYFVLDTNLWRQDPSDSKNTDITTEQLQDQIDWMEEELKKEILPNGNTPISKAIIFTHHPLYLDNKDENDNINTYDHVPKYWRDKIFNLLDKYLLQKGSNYHIFSGHLHYEKVIDNKSVASLALSVNYENGQNMGNFIIGNGGVRVVSTCRGSPEVDQEFVMMGTSSACTMFSSILVFMKFLI